MNTQTQTTIPPEFTPAYVPYSYKGQPVKGAFGANTRPAFVKTLDRAYYDAGVKRDDVRQLFIAMDLFDTGAGTRPVGDFNYGNIKTRRGQSGRAGYDKTERSNDEYAIYASPAEYARAKVALVLKPSWGVNLETDSPADIIDKIIGQPYNAYGTLLSDAARIALETGKGIEQLPTSRGGYEGEQERVKRYRAQGITDIGRARQKMYGEKLTPIARQVAIYMAGGDPNVSYTPGWERKANQTPIPPQNPTPIEPPVVPPIRPVAPGAPEVKPMPDLKQGPLPLTEEAFDALAFTRRSEARLMNGQKVTVTAVDFAKRQISHHKNGHPYWVELNQIAAIS